MNEIEIIQPNSMEIPIQTVKQEIISHFTKDQIKFLLNKLPPNNHGMIFQFLWRTGVRVTELISFLRKDIDFENNEITIRWLKNRKFNYRVIPLHSSLKNPLYMYTAKMKYEERVFPMSRQRVDQISKKYGFGHAHKLRHSYAINFLRQSSSPMALVELKDLLGHSSVNTTMEYLKVVPQNTKDAVERISFD